MELKNKLFSYPVMSGYTDDYIENTFSTIVEVRNNINTVDFFLEYILTNQEFKSLLENEEIDVVFHIECSKTSFRKIIVMHEHLKMAFSINSKDINGKTVVSSYIVAKKNIENFKNKYFNEDYSGIEFNITRGSVLAIGNTFNINVEHEIDNLGNAESIFSITRRDVELEKGMMIEISRNKIEISLDTETFQNYSTMARNTNLMPIIHSCLILPALVFALDKVKEDDDIGDYEDYKWYKSIKHKLMLSGIELNSEINSFEIAQKILDMPICKAFSSLIEIDSGDEI